MGMMVVLYRVIGRTRVRIEAGVGGQTLESNRVRDGHGVWDQAWGQGLLSKSWDFPLVKWLRLHTSNAGSVGLIPGQHL